MNGKNLNKSMIIELENAESRYWSEYYNCIPSNLKNKLGLTSNIINGAFVGALSNVDILAFNRTIGFGNEYAINENNIRALIKFYQRVGVKRFFLPHSPVAGYISEIQDLSEYGFKFHNNWVKFYKKLKNQLPVQNSCVKIVNASPKENHTFDKIIQEGFDWEEEAALLFSQTIGRPGWNHYFATKDDKPIAAASMYYNGHFASLAIAATLPDYRRYGAQSALITQRINDAIDMGCKYMAVETAENKPGKFSASNRNMKRFGFDLAYLRPNYIYYFNN
jgi:ribosomal protein S18 acetylase RimI-like enzyme